MSDYRRLHLGAFVTATGNHIAGWRHPAAHANADHDIDHYRELATTAERGKFDLMFVADSPADLDGDPKVRARVAGAARFEPITLWSALSQVTQHVGFVATASTTYEDPYLLARRFLSLDHISKGRAGWNVVTTAGDVSRNFTVAGHPAHAERYERAEEFVDLVLDLWDSYEDDAFLRDKQSGIYSDQSKLHRVHHKGRFFSVSGPLNVARSPQGRPVVVLAGSSEPGRELTARTAEVVFTATRCLKDGKAFYNDVKGRLQKFGRHPNEMVIMPGLLPIIGGTEAEALRKYEDLQSLVHPNIAWAILSEFYPNIDLSLYSLDDRAPHLPPLTESNKSRHKLVSDLASEGMTFRQLYLSLATARGHRTVIGTPEQIADEMCKWFKEGAADGFNIMPAVLPQDLEDFVNEVLPYLQHRGLFRTEYEGGTLRENLGLEVPQNRLVARNLRPSG
ncbi:LLM class flavin-dependent oxidoreductase [Rhizobium sp.]|uniref:LLM class flavin-dependent oxidoreductase n=1 Tax=Rhizobium sp. TaxID=391 RepID=UPI000E90AF07|nr:nitrilotriacetate monooxygenase [Rhizobium sp.]